MTLDIERVENLLKVSQTARPYLKQVRRPPFCLFNPVVKRNCPFPLSPQIPIPEAFLRARQGSAFSLYFWAQWAKLFPVIKLFNNKNLLGRHVLLLLLSHYRYDNKTASAPVHTAVIKVYEAEREMPESGSASRAAKGNSPELGQ